MGDLFPSKLFINAMDLDILYIFNRFLNIRSELNILDIFSE